MRWWSTGNVASEVPVRRRVVHDDEARFWTYVAQGLGGCLLWIGAIDEHGYGRFGLGLRAVLAHRWAYERFVGAVPDGLEPDHLCRTPGCVNPEHLELVTHRANVLRGDSPAAVNARKTHCDYGHEFTPENTAITPRGHRRCRECNRRNCRERYQRRSVATA